MPPHYEIIHRLSRFPLTNLGVVISAASLAGKQQTYTNIIVIALTRPGLEPRIYCTRDNHAHHYTIFMPLHLLENLKTNFQVTYQTWGCAPLFLQIDFWDFPEANRDFPEANRDFPEANRDFQCDTVEVYISNPQLFIDQSFEATLICTFYLQWLKSCSWYLILLTDWCYGIPRANHEF